jgi:hypothetical protein
MTTWISAPEAFAHVLSHEVAPEFAHDKILEAIRERKLPVRARLMNFYGEDGETEILPMSFWDATDVSIDFESGTARSIIVWTSLGSIPAHATENARDLEFSCPHLLALWPRPEEENDQAERDEPQKWRDLPPMQQGGRSRRPRGAQRMTFGRGRCRRARSAS